jgi:S1-C subfamily serine protease
MTVAPGGQIGRKRGRRMSGMTWMFLGLLIFFISAGVFTAVLKRFRPIFRPPPIVAEAPRSFAGVSTPFETTAGGVTFARVTPPGGPADKAGLVGGDIITAVDGQPVQTDDEMRAMLRRIEVGKTVDIVYLRDGEIKTTKMTTISEDEMDRLTEAFDDRPEGQGLFGYENNAAERVEIPELRIFGVQLNDVNPNNPADIAGIKNGDIVIEFDKIPIRTPSEFLARVRRALPASIVNIVVIRNGERLEIPVKMGKG